MSNDNSDTTHLDAYPVKREWNRLPWWVRAGLPLAAIVAFGEFILVDPAKLFTPRSPWEVVSSVLTEMCALEAPGFSRGEESAAGNPSDIALFVDVLLDDGQRSSAYRGHEVGVRPQRGDTSFQ